MKKNVKVLSGALAASLTMGAMPVFAADMSADELYKAAFEAVLAAQEARTQESINAARTAIKALAGTDAEFAVGEFSKQVDGVQQELFEGFLAALDKAQESNKQADINAARTYVEMFRTCPDTLVYVEGGWSQEVDLVQQKLIDKAEAAVRKAQETKLQADVDAAKALLVELATSTNKDVTTWVTAIETELEAVKVIDLEVTKVNAIDENGVTVVFEAVTEAQENVTIEVKDPEGNIVEVKPLNLEIGDTEVTFDFVTVYDADKLPLGNWAVAGKVYDTAADAAVAKVVSATNAVELWNALQSPYFKGAVEAKITQYETAVDTAVAAGKLNTVADVNKIIKDVNDAGLEAAEEAAVVKKVADATNVLQLLNALKDGGFERVNDAWITDSGYAEENVDGASVNMLALTDANYFGETDGATIEAIQAAIDAVNVAKVEASIADAEGNLDLAKITTARNLVNVYIADDKEDETAKADYLKQLTLHEAVVNVTLANTNAKLNNALVTLDKLTDAFDIATVNANELTRYRKDITEAVAADKDTAAEIQTLITTANTAAETAAVVAVAAINADTTTAELKALLTTLADRSKFVAEAFVLNTVNDALLEDYKKAMLADPAPAMTTAAEIQTIITTANDPATALTALEDSGSQLTDADKLLAALKVKTLNLKNIVDANKDAYFADIADIKTNAGTGASSKEKVANVQAVINATNARLVFNVGGSVSALTNFAIATNDTDYINLSSAAKAEVAALVKAEKPVAGYTTNALVTAEISAQISERGTLINGVNNATNIVDMNKALTALEYAPYEALSSAEKLVVAEAFIANFPMDNAETPARVPYTTIAGIQAAIDAAIAR